MSRALLLSLVVVMAPLAAQADRGALTVDAGGGFAAPFLKAPYSTDSSALRVLTGSAWLGGRYGLTNNLELSLSAFWEPSVQVFHNATTVRFDGSDFPGTLGHKASRYGGLAGGRLVFGYVWRVSLGLEAGWSHRVYSGFDHIDDSRPGAAVSYGLQLQDFSTDNLVVAPLAGLEWMPGDSWSISIVPRTEILLGPDPTLAISVPLLFSWSWYL
jgi:hypothetical protein